MFTHLVIASIESFFYGIQRNGKGYFELFWSEETKLTAQRSPFQPLKLDPSVTCAKINGGQVLNGREKKEKPTPPMQCCWTQEFDLEFYKWLKILQLGDSLALSKFVTNISKFGQFEQLCNFVAKFITFSWFALLLQDFIVAIYTHFQ